MKIATETTVEKLNRFVNQRSGLDFVNYGDIKLYRKEAREITNDRNDYYELLAIAATRIENFETVLTNYLTNSNDRLTLTKETIEYITGQYFPTEYRPAACGVLQRLIWADYANEKNEDGTPVYSNGSEIRAAIKRKVSRRVYNNYFN